MSVRGFRDSLRSYVPQWLADRPSLRTGFTLLYVIAGLCDRAVQAALEGVRAGWPGFDGRTDNLTLLGDSRSLLRGETETAPHFETRLQQWLTTALDMGGDVGLAKQLHEWVAGNPMIRVITRNGLYTTIAADGAVSQVTAAWDWDSVSNPERNVGGAGSVGRFDMWIVVYPTTATGYPGAGFYVPTTGHWGDGQGPGLSKRGIGNTGTSTEADTIRGLIATRRGGHITPRTLIWSYDAAAFDPATPARSGNPDGTWGRWFHASSCEASRNRTHRYTSLGPERL